MKLDLFSNPLTFKKQLFDDQKSHIPSAQNWPYTHVHTLVSPFWCSLHQAYTQVYTSLHTHTKYRYTQSMVLETHNSATWTHGSCIAITCHCIHTLSPQFSLFQHTHIQSHTATHEHTHTQHTHARTHTHTHRWLVIKTVIWNALGYDCMHGQFWTERRWATCICDRCF